MKKYIKWGIVIIVGAGLTTLGIHTFTPRENHYCPLKIANSSLK